jgi:hypothetical protein
MRSLVFFAVLVGTVAVMPAHAQTDSRGAPKYNRIELQQFYGYQLKELREEALRRKAAEGGTISSVSLADLQGQLDRINAGRIRDAKRNDSWSVDAFGRSTRPKD